MYSSIEVHGYRGFDSFKLSGLGHVNLLVGKNNSGKTSILECIELLQSGGSPQVLNSILRRRGELVHGPRRSLPVVRHLFAGHDVVGRRLTIAGEECDGGTPRQVSLHSEEGEGGELLPSAESEPEGGDFEGEELAPYVLHVASSAMAEPFRTKMTSTGVLPKFRFVPRSRQERPALFLPTEGMTVAEIGDHFSDVVLTEREKHVLDALRVVEPAIERIAPVALERSPLARPTRSGVFAKLKDVEERVPLGILGDGLWRMLGLALALANCHGGVLLIDEIDTGLHHTVMEDMWRMMSERAAALSVQVFATTHSGDCWKSLRAIAKPDSISCGEVTIQRIDRQRQKAIRYDRDAIVAADERDREVR